MTTGYEQLSRGRWQPGSLSHCAALALLVIPSIIRAQDVPDFQTAIAPLISKHCVSCHSGDQPKGELNLQSRASMLMGGESGPALEPGSASTSLIYEKIAGGEMPPEGRPPLSAAELQLLESWINSGAQAPDIRIPLPPDASFEITAEDRAHWAFQPLRDVRVPDASHPLIQTPVDSFIYARLAAEGLEFSPQAERRTLIRRVYFDLIGLPPPSAEVEAFIADPHEDAYERLLDRLLASPHFGERWGRHWLDGAGYADVIGMDNDASIISTGENKWLYRDYVIQSLNRDKPFPQFLTEQLAGDELVDWRTATTFTPEIREKLVATGFLRNSADDTAANELNTPLIHHGVLQRTGEVLVSNLLGLTFNCAKCHDHKYEPIAQRDYYQMLAILQPAFNPQSWLQPAQRQLPDLAPAEKTAAEQQNAQLDQKIAELQTQLTELRRPYESMLAAKKLELLPEVIRPDTQAAIAMPVEQRNAVQKYLADKFEAVLKVTPEEITAALAPAEHARENELQQQVNTLTSQKKSWTHLQVVYDVAAPTPTHLLVRGNHEVVGDEVAPGFLQILCTADATAAAAPQGHSSGRRLSLAHWLTDVHSPAGALVLRVRVNRVWQQLFGRGIVETADNFGVTGAVPTHPDLLEWLAHQFAASGQQQKQFLKLLMMSHVYRQSSHRGGSGSAARAAQIDPDNRWLSRMPLRRLESEAIRDAILASSNHLNGALGGAPIPVTEQPADGAFVIQVNALPAPSSAWRRSIYLLARRNYHPTILSVFDQPNMNSNCARRTDSAVVLQSLTLLNDAFLLEQSEKCADQILMNTQRSDPRACVEAAMLSILGRPAEAAEISSCAKMLERHTDYYLAQGIPSDEAGRKALAHLCHVLFNTSEFLYVP